MLVNNRAYKNIRNRNNENNTTYRNTVGAVILLSINPWNFQSIDHSLFHLECFNLSPSNNINIVMIVLITNKYLPSPLQTSFSI